MRKQDKSKTKRIPKATKFVKAESQAEPGVAKPAMGQRRRRPFSPVMPYHCNLRRDEECIVDVTLALNTAEGRELMKHVRAAVKPFAQREVADFVEFRR